MSKKLMLSLLFVVLGLASVDAFLDHEEWNLGSQGDEAAVASMQDGTGMPPRP